MALEFIFFCFSSPFLLSDEDYGYMASEFGLMMTLCFQDARAVTAGDGGGGEGGMGLGGGGARVTSRLMQLLQVRGAYVLAGGGGSVRGV
jgi:hypothetical protein